MFWSTVNIYYLKCCLSKTSAILYKFGVPCVVSYEFPMFSTGYLQHRYLEHFVILNHFSAPVLVIYPISRTSCKPVQYRNRVPKEKRYYGCTDLNSFKTTHIVIWFLRLVFAEWRHLRSMKLVCIWRLKTSKVLSLLFPSFGSMSLEKTKEQKIVNRVLRTRYASLKELDKGH